MSTRLSYTTLYLLGMSMTTWLPDYLMHQTGSSSTTGAPRLWATAAYPYSRGSMGHLSAFMQLLLVNSARLKGVSTANGVVIRSLGMAVCGTVLLLAPGLGVPAWPGTVWDIDLERHPLAATKVGEASRAASDGAGEPCDLAFEASLKHVQPSAWAMLYVDLHLCLFLLPAGLAALSRPPAPGAAPAVLAPQASALVVVYSAWSVYVAALQRNMAAQLAVPASVTSAVAILALLRPYLGKIRRAPLLAGERASARKPASKNGKAQDEDAGEEAGIGLLVVAAAFLAVLVFVWHSTWSTQFLYSSPALVVSGKTAEGARVALDDLSDAMSFLREHTPPAARVLAWWEYGDAIAVLGNREPVIDAQSCSCAHSAPAAGQPGARHPCAPCISKVAQLLLSPPHEAAAGMHSLGVDYVVLVAGGYTGYQADDVNKVRAMLRLASCGASAHEWGNRSADYLVEGKVRVGTAGGAALKGLKDSLLFALSYVGFSEVQTEFGRQKVLTPPHACRPFRVLSGAASTNPPRGPLPDGPSDGFHMYHLVVLAPGSDVASTLEDSRQGDYVGNGRRALTERAPSWPRLRCPTLTDCRSSKCSPRKTGSSASFAASRTLRDP